MGFCTKREYMAYNRLGKKPSKIKVHQQFCFSDLCWFQVFSCNFSVLGETDFQKSASNHSQTELWKIPVFVSKFTNSSQMWFNVINRFGGLSLHIAPTVRGSSVILGNHSSKSSLHWLQPDTNLPFSCELPFQCYSCWSKKLCSLC